MNLEICRLPPSSSLIEIKHKGLVPAFRFSRRVEPDQSVPAF
jgi:hypothetical protein